MSERAVRDPDTDTVGSRTLDSLGPSIEAVLLHADKAVSHGKLAAAIGLLTDADADGENASKAARSRVEEAVAGLNREYESTGRSFRIESVAGGLRLMTLSEFAPVLAAFRNQRAQSRLSKAAVETLAIIAYRQPVTRAEVEAIRGVACGEVLKTLLDHRLATITGRAEEIGRPMLYGTTRQFLERFGLASLKDLPEVADLPSPA